MSKLDDLFWPTLTETVPPIVDFNPIMVDLAPFMEEVTREELEGIYPKRTELPKIKWAGLPVEPEYGDDFDELSHIQEQYNIKCDELKDAMMENRRLSLIILKHGLDAELEIIEDETNDSEEDEEG